MLSALLLALLPSAPQDPPRPAEEVLIEIRAAGNEVPAALLEELAKHRDAEACAGLIESLEQLRNQDKLCAGYRALRHFAGVAEAAEAAADYLEEQARRRQEKLALHAVYRLGALGPAARDALVALALDHATADGRSVAVMHLVALDMPLTDKELAKFARSEDLATRYEALLARRARLEQLAQQEKALAKLARGRDPAERLAAVELLASREHPQRYPILERALEDKHPPVGRKALASLERCRSPEAVRILVARMAQCRAGEAHRTAAALRRLTGLSFGPQSDAWSRWWLAEGEGFVPAPPELADAEGAGGSVEADTAAAFYGLSILAERLVFAIDTSDSMKEAAGRYGDRSRLQLAKEELKQAIQALPKGAAFEIVNFGKSAWSWQGELVEAKRKTREQALEHVDRLQMSWGTEVYRALRESFRDPRADSILLLTDGDPQLSLMQDRAALRRIVAQWNRTRHTTIDCLSIGTERGWLRKLAETTGGRYRRVD